MTKNMIVRIRVDRRVYQCQEIRKTVRRLDRITMVLYGKKWSSEERRKQRILNNKLRYLYKPVYI